MYLDVICSTSQPEYRGLTPISPHAEDDCLCAFLDASAGGDHSDSMGGSRLRSAGCLVRDMKNPGQKIGNDVWCHLPDEAWAILCTMPKVKREIFPYNAKSVSASFTRACPMLGIEDLHFHHLRHEGVSRLFEMDWDIPRVSSVSGHRDWNSLRRYTHLHKRGDTYFKWKWLTPLLEYGHILIWPFNLSGINPK